MSLVVVVVVVPSPWCAQQTQHPAMGGCRGGSTSPCHGCTLETQGQGERKPGKGEKPDLISYLLFALALDCPTGGIRRFLSAWRAGPHGEDFFRMNWVFF